MKTCVVYLLQTMHYRHSDMNKIWWCGRVMVKIDGNKFEINSLTFCKWRKEGVGGAGVGRGLALGV